MVSPPELRYPDPPLAGDGWIMRPWRADDAEAVMVACRDEHTQRFITFLPRDYTLEDARVFIERTAENFAAGRAIAMAIANGRDRRAIGSITLHTHDTWHWSIGYWMTPGARGRGIASAAAWTFARWAFSVNPALARLSLHTLPDNLASQHVAERAGFTREGVLRRWDNLGGTPLDVVMFSLIRDDLASGG